MMGNRTLFLGYNSCNENLIVKIADGSHSRVTRISDISIPKELTLKRVLHVSNLDYNLSIRNFTQDHNCFAKFFLNLLLVRKLVQDHNYFVKFSSNLCEL